MKKARSVRAMLIIAGILVFAGVAAWVTIDRASANVAEIGSVVTDGTVLVFSGGSTDEAIQYGYSIDVAARFADAGVTYDYLTKAGIAKYVAFNKDVLQSLATSNQENSFLWAIVTFVRPLTQPEFDAFVSQYNIQVKSYTIWVANQDETTTTILGAPSDTELVPQQIFESVLADTTARGGKVLSGWVDVRGNMPLSDLNQLAVDKRVFLADVTEELIREQFTDAAMAKAGIPATVRASVLTDELQIRRPPLAWQVRELELGAIAR